MKKIFKIILVAVLATACSLDEFAVYDKGDVITEGKIEVGIGITTSNQPSTRALDNDAEIRSLKVVVYDENGVYVEQMDATLDATEKKWFAMLSLSEKERRLHLLANYTEEVPYGLDEQEIAKISTNQDVYWQKVVLTDGITATLTDDDPPKLTLNDPGRLQGIKLVRNFAKVTITSNKVESKLEIISAGLFNIPNIASLAPYSAERGKFLDDYLDYDTPSALMTAVAGYEGNEPVEGMNLLNTEESAFTLAVIVPETDEKVKSVSMFMFERETPRTDAPYVIVKGYYNGSTDPSYYKFNLRIGDTTYFPILRNFEYRINVKSVHDGGFATLAEAMASAGSGDISTDLRFQSLTNISNSTARMFVNYTEMVLVTAKKVELKYKFIPDLEHTSDVMNAQVEVSLGAPSPLGAVFSSMDQIVNHSGTMDSDYFSTIQLTPNEPSEVARKQTLILRGRYEVKVGEEEDPETHEMLPKMETRYITREVNFILREKPQLRLKCIGDRGENNVVSATKESNLDLKIGVPAGLSESMFPLNLAIEARELTITPQNIAGNHLPSTTGKSLFGSDIPGFQFVRTLTYSEYNGASQDSEGYKYFDAKFKTNVAASATDIVVANEYFNPGTTYFINPGGSHSYRFDFLELVSMPGNKAEVEFNMPTTDPVTITLNNLVPEGKNADKMTYVSPGMYTYTPSAPGMQIIGLGFTVSGRAYDVNLSATNYTPANKAALGIGRPDVWFNGSDYTTDSQALIPGASTTITARLSFNSEIGRSVSFKVNGENRTASHLKTEDGFEYYTCTYTVPTTHNSPTFDVEVLAADETTSAVGDLGNIPVWKATVTRTSGSTTITTAANLSARTGKTYDSANNKYVFNGITFSQNGYYLLDNGTTLVTSHNNYKNAGNVFTCDGSNYLKSFFDNYLTITGTSQTNFRLVKSDYSLNVNQNDNTWQFRRVGSTGYRLQNQSGGGTLRIYNSNYYTSWTAYPVTVEYVAP